MTDPLPHGVHHVGHAVPDLESAVGFFIEVLDWKLVNARA